ncbi:MAG TPA: redoxin family protein [Solirubrobacterales bacterium]|nr:redoxin family protein [Solirubrobacterales bacterium]
MEDVLPDVLEPGLSAVFCGNAAGTVAARVGAPYAGPGNRFWITLHEVGLTPVLLAPTEFRRLPEFGLGVTGVCKTRFGSDAEVGLEAHDPERFRAAIARVAPRHLAFVGKRAAEAVLGAPVTYGPQAQEVDGAHTWVLPSTSGRARRFWDIRPWRELARVIAEERDGAVELCDPDGHQSSTAVSDYAALPPDLPVPEDDGGADHLPGMRLPALTLPSTQDGELDLPNLAAERLVAYLYPRTGVPGVPLPDGWDDIPGARGCTPQSCAYRDALAEFERHGATVVGISAQAPAAQAEFAAREHIPFPLLSDENLRLADALRLPTFEVEGTRLYRRLTLIAESGRIVKALYPVFPPDRDAAEVLAWLSERV